MMIDDPENDLTAKSWIIMDFKNESYIRGQNFNKKYQIASITKMYTLYACLLLNEAFNINPEVLWVQIPQTIEVGTLANLKYGKYITVLDLYYGLMLPSGNDAAMVLSIYYGNWLSANNYFPNFVWNCKNIKKNSLESKKKYFGIYNKKFMQFVNQQVIEKRLKHKNTRLQNSHGLASKFHYSTAWQIAQAAIHFLKNQLFFKISKTAKYSSQYLDGQQFCWQNTNQLLKSGQGYEGVKTGHTANAGHCLCSFRKFYLNDKHYQIVTVVLGCKSQDLRFKQTKIICQQYQAYLNMMNI